MGFGAGADERYLGFGERSNAVDQRGNVVENYVADGPYQPDGVAADQPLRPALGLPRRATTPTYFPMPWLLSTAATACSSTAPRPATSGSHRRPARGASRSSARRRTSCAPAARRRRGPVSLRFFAGPEPADALRALHGRDRPPAAGRGAVVLRAVVPAHRRHDEQRRTSTSCSSADAPLSVAPDLHALPALRRPARPARGSERAADRRRPRARARDHHLLQPDGLHRATQPAFGEAAADGGADSRTRPASPTSTATHRPTTVRRRPVRLHRRGGPRGLRRGGSTRRSTTATTAGWRTSASTRRSTRSSADGRAGRADRTTPTRASTTAPAHEAIADAPRPVVRFQRSRLDRRGAVRAGGLGRRPDHRLGLRRPRARRCARR